MCACQPHTFLTPPGACHPAGRYECDDLIARLKLERERNEVKQTKEIQETTRSYDKLEASHQKQCKAQLEKLSKGQAKTLAHHVKQAKVTRRSRASNFDSSCSAETKDVKREAKTLPKVLRTDDVLMCHVVQH